MVFTEFGAIQAANVLRSKRAVEVSVFVVRAFVRMREALSVHKDILRKINDMESKYDGQFKLVFEALRKLMVSPAKPRRRIGFGGTELDCTTTNNNTGDTGAMHLGGHD